MLSCPTATIPATGNPPMTAPADEDRVRGNVYALLGNLLAAPPGDDLLQVLRGIAPEPGDASLLAASWQLLAVAAGRATPAELREEYDALFIGVGRGEIVPYGSWYLTGFLMEQPLAQLRGDLRALGIERQPGVCEPEDHAAALCDTMALLITSDAPASLDEQHRFYARHLEPWLPQFFRDLQQASSARFYRAVGQLGEQFIGVESQAFRVTIPAAGGAMPS
jgi:TorA maturation chaperone TorD